MKYTTYETLMFFNDHLGEEAAIALLFDIPYIQYNSYYDAETNETHITYMNIIEE